MLATTSKLVASACTKRQVASGVRSLSTGSPWSGFAMAPPDPIIGLNEAYQKDDFPHKVNVGVGAYRDSAGKPYVLPCVREAERRLSSKGLDMEYSGITGDPKFVDNALKFVFGADSSLFKDGRVEGVQALSGTGGLRVFGELLKRHGHSQIYVPNPTWGNHIPIFGNSGLEVKKYRYYSPEKSVLDFDGLIEDFKAIPEGTVVLLHACAHNPTGMDPSLEQWQQISHLMKQRNLLPFFDCAYQGFASGDAATDAAAIRMFADDGHLMAVVQSFSKNFGLYGHRIGALSVVGANPDEAKRVVSQLKQVIRPMYSNPPRHGARIINEVLSDEQLAKDFISECKGMADRINSIRVVLRQKLEDAGSTHNWEHVTKQIGMFAYSGLSKEQVTTMRDRHHIYCTLDGRISMAGVTPGNVDYIANAIHDVSK